MHVLDPRYPDFSDESLRQTVSGWLTPYLYGLRSRQDLQKLNLYEILQGQLDWDQLQKLETWAPTHITVPSGSRIPIDYSSPEAPILAVRLQEMFGATETPCIGNDRVPLTLHLLSPANRPMQITRDLKSFWQTGYFDVKKDMKGRYSKHYWPDNPLEAIPTRRTRPR